MPRPETFFFFYKKKSLNAQYQFSTASSLRNSQCWVWPGPWICLSAALRATIYASSWPLLLLSLFKFPWINVLKFFGAFCETPNWVMSSFHIQVTSIGKDCPSLP